MKKGSQERRKEDGQLLLFWERRPPPPLFSRSCRLGPEERAVTAGRARDVAGFALVFEVDGGTVRPRGAVAKRVGVGHGWSAGGWGGMWCWWCFACARSSAVRTSGAVARVALEEPAGHVSRVVGGPGQGKHLALRLRIALCREMGTKGEMECGERGMNRPAPNYLLVAAFLMPTTPPPTPTPCGRAKIYTYWRRKSLRFGSRT